MFVPGGGVSRQQLRRPEPVVQGGELGRRERRAVRVQRSGHRGEKTAGLELTARRLQGLQVIPCGLPELVDDVRRVGARVREVRGEDLGPGGRVRARGRRGVPAETGGRVGGYRGRQAAEHHQAGHEGGRRVADDPGRDAAPDARLARARLGLARPEHRPAQDGQQRGEQREPGQQHHPDADR